MSLSPVHLLPERGEFLRDGATQPPCQLLTVIFFLGAANLDLVFSHVVCYCFACDTEEQYTAMRMPSTTNSRISEMAIVGQLQPFNLLY